MHGNEPGCIVGNVLHRLGVPLETLAQYEATPAYDVAQSLISEGVLTSNGEAMRLLNVAQIAQDSGMNWGDTVRRAKRQVL